MIKGRKELHIYSIAVGLYFWAANSVARRMQFKKPLIYSPLSMGVGGVDALREKPKKPEKVLRTGITGDCVFAAPLSSKYF